MIRKKQVIISKIYMTIYLTDVLGCLFAENLDAGKRMHMLIKSFAYYDKIYLYSKNLEQEKYALLSKTFERITEQNKILIDEIFHTSNEEIIPKSEMEDAI